jgi:hypothetical protein
VSDIDSALTSQYSNVTSVLGTLATAASLSDLASDVKSAVVAAQSDLRSQADAQHSDLKSAVGTVSVTIGASDISAIASAVAASGGITASQIWTYASRTLTSSDLSALRSAITAGTSDVKSAVTAAQSDIRSQATVIQSDIKSAITVGPTSVIVGASSLSVLRSAITAGASDVKSAVAATSSDVKSAVAAQASDLRSYLAGISGVVSDIDSALTSQYSNVTSVLGTANSVLAKLDTAVELDGAVYRFTENALEEAPSGTGGDATEANQTAMLAVLIAQREIDTTATPWQLVLKDRTTGAELYRFDLKDSSGDAVAAIDTFVASQTTPA